MLKMVAHLEEMGEYDKAIKYLDEILQDNHTSYHALFLKFRVNKKRGFIDRVMLAKALNEAKAQDASSDVMAVIEEEMKEISNMKSNEDILEKIRKIERLIDGAKSDGEKAAAIEAKRRLDDKKYEEISDDLIEYRISTEDMWHKKLFMALCRKHNCKPYRYYRQKHTTVMVKISKSYLDNVLWKEYLEYSKQLTSLIHEITGEIISKIYKYEEETVIMGEIGYGE